MFGLTVLVNIDRLDCHACHFGCLSIRRCCSMHDIDVSLQGHPKGFVEVVRESLKALGIDSTYPLTQMTLMTDHHRRRPELFSPQSQRLEMEYAQPIRLV